MSNFWEKDEPVKAAPTSGNTQNFWEKDTPVAPAPDQSVPHAVASGIANQFVSSLPIIGPLLQPVAPALTHDYANLMANSWHRETANSALANLAENLNEQQQIKSDPNYALKASQPPGAVGGGAYSGLGGINWTTPVVTPSPSERLASLKQGQVSLQQDFTQATNNIKANTSNNLTAFNAFNEAKTGGDMAKAFLSNPGQVFGGTMASGAWPLARGTGMVLGTGAAVAATGGGAIPVALAGGAVGGLDAGIHAYPRKIAEVLQSAGRKSGIDIEAHPELLSKVMSDPKIYAEAASEAKAAGINDAIWMGVLSAAGLGAGKIASVPLRVATNMGVQSAGGAGMSITEQLATKGKVDDWSAVRHGGVGGLMNAIPFEAYHAVTAKKGPPPLPKFTPEAKPGEPAPVQSTLGVDAQGNPIEVQPEAAPAPAPAANPARQALVDAVTAADAAYEASIKDINTRDGSDPVADKAALDKFNAAVDAQRAAQAALQAFDKNPATPAAATPPAATVSPAPAALPEGHVQPMPSGQNAESAAWYSKYGKTHEVDGTPLSPDEAARAAGSTSIADVVAPEEAAPKVDTAQVLAQKKAQLDAINRQLDAAGRRITDETTLAQLDAEHERISGEYEDALAAHENAQNAAKPKSIADVVAPKEANTDTMSRKEEIRFIEAEINRRQIEVDNAKKNGRSAPEAEAAIERLKVRLGKAHESQQTPTMGNPALPRSVQMLDAEAAASAARAATAKPAAPAPKQAAVATPAQEAKPTAPAPVAEAAPAGEPALVKRTKSIDQAIEQIAKLEARLANATPKEANQIRNQLNLRKKQVNAYEKDNGRPKMYDLKAKPVAAEPTPVAEPVAPVEPAAAAEPAAPVEQPNNTDIPEGHAPPAPEPPGWVLGRNDPEAQRARDEYNKSISDWQEKYFDTHYLDGSPIKSKPTAAVKPAKATPVAEAETPAETQAEPGEEPKVATATELAPAAPKYPGENAPKKVMDAWKKDYRNWFDKYGSTHDRSGNPNPEGVASEKTFSNGKPKEEPKTPVAETTPVEEAPKTKTEPTAPDAEKTKTIIKGLEDQIAKSEKAGRGDSEQTKKQRATLEAAKAKLAEMEGTPKEAETPAETQAEPGEEPAPASTPEREAKIKAILDNADASHVSHTFNVREVIEHKGSDGKWYTNGWPRNVKLTGEKRVGGWGITDKNGIGIGKRYATEAEAKASLENNRAGLREQFKKALETSSDERLNDQAKTWEEQKAAFERNNPEIAKQRETAARQSKPVEPAKNTEQPKTSEKVNFREKKASGEDPKVEGRKRLASLDGEGVLRMSADGNIEIVTPEWRVTHDPETNTWNSKSIGRETYESLSRRYPIEKTETTKGIEAENAKNAADALDAENEAKQKRLREEAQGRADNQAWREKVNAEVKGKKGTFEASKLRDGKESKETTNATIYGDGWAVAGSGNDYGVFHTKTGLRLRGNMSREQATTLAKGLVHGEIDPNFTDPNSVGTEVKNKIKDIMQSAVSGSYAPEYLSETAAPAEPAKAAEPTPLAEAPKAEVRASNLTPENAWQEAAEKGKSSDVKKAETLFELLSNVEGRNNGKGYNPEALTDAAIKQGIKDGYLQKKGQKVSLTEEGRSKLYEVRSEVEGRNFDKADVWDAVQSMLEIPARKIESNNFPVPEGYVKEGDKYIYKPEDPKATKPNPTAEPAKAAEPAPVEPAKASEPEEKPKTHREILKESEPDFENLASEAEAAASGNTSAHREVNATKRGLLTRIRKVFNTLYTPEELVKHLNDLADEATQIADEHGEKQSNIEDMGRDDPFSDRDTLIDTLNDLSDHLRNTAEDIEKNNAGKPGVSEGAKPVEQTSGNPTENASNEKQLEDVNNKLADLERHNEGESPEAEALRKQRDELQGKIDAGKPASPDARSDSEKWADDVLKRSRGQFNSGVDPEVVAALAVKGYHIAARTIKGVAIDFHEWSKEMVKEFGDGVKPHLEAAWNKVRDPNLAREVAEHQQARIDAGKPSLDLHAELARSAATLDADRQIALAAAADKNKPSTMTNLYQAVIGNPLAAWFRSNGSRMRSLVELNPGSAEIKKVVEQFIGTPGKNGERYFTHVVANQTGAFLNKFVMATNKLLFHPDYQKMTPEQRQALNTQLINAIESGKEFQGAFGEAVKGIKDLMAETHKYGTEAGLEMGHAANYFPRGMDGEAIRSNPEAFVQAAAKAYEAKWNREQASPERTTTIDPKTGKEQVATQQGLGIDEGGQVKKPDFVEMARKWKDAILFSHEGRDFEENILGEKKPANKENFQKEREFTKEEAKLFDQFRDKDVGSLVARHIGDMVRKAEIAKRLGSEGEKWIASKKQMAADGVSDAHVENLRKLIRNQMGLDQPGEYVPTRDVEGTPTTIGEKIVKGAERFRRYVESSDNTLMKAVQLHTALVYLTKTPALMAAEPAAIAMRKGEALGGARMIAQNLVRFSNVLKRAEPGSLKAINTEIERVYGKGHDLASAISLELGITRLSNDFMSQGSGFFPEDISRSSLQGLDKLSEGVQKMYLLHQMETAKRETGVKEGMNYLDKLVDHANGENMMVNILKKHLGRETDGGMFDTRQFGANNLEGLGIPKSEHAQFSDFVKKLRGMSESERLSAIMDRNDPMAARYRKGVELFSKQATVQSTSASKTEVANSSNVGKVIFNLLTYPQEFALQHKAFLHEQSKLLMSGKDSGVSPAEKLKAASTMFALAPAAAAMWGVTKLYRAYDNLEFNSDDEHEQQHVMGLPAPVSEAITSVSRTGLGGAPTEMAWRSLERGEPPAPIITSLGGEIFKAVSGNSDAKRTGKVLFKDVAAPFGNAAMIKAADAVPAGIGRGIPKLVAKGAAFVGTHVMAHKKASDAAGEALAGE